MKRSIWRHGFFTGAALVSLTIAVSVPATVASAASLRPSAPRSVHASAATASAHVNWSRPVSIGISAIRGYVVTSHPSSRRCATAATSCVVKGLTAGASYTFTVIAKNGAGASPSSSPSNRVTIALSIATAGTDYLAALSTFDSSLNADLTAINALTATSTQAQVTAALTALKKTFATYTGTLGKDKWPSVAQADVATFTADMTTFGTDYAALFGATSASDGALLADTLEKEANTYVVADAKVRTDLKLPQLISGPVASTSTPAVIGAAQVVHDFYGDAMSITVTQIVDPATAGANSGLPDAGYRFVAVEANFANTTGEVDGDANLAMTVVGSDGQTYTADFGTASQCTNFTYGEFAVPAGDTASGCVLFQLPTAVTVKSISFTLDAGYLDTVVWNA